MSHGIVIGTYDSLGSCGNRFGVAAVELNLAVIRANCGADVPILVCDDSSPLPSQLAYRALCARHGAEFSTRPQRLGHTSGDIATFGRGLEWARELGLQTLTKLSQRMIFDIPDWISREAKRLLKSGFGTMAAALANYGQLDRVRTEAVMMVVAAWGDSRVTARYQPGRYWHWNEGHTYDTMRQFIDRSAAFPPYLPWSMISPVRGWDVPPVYFRDMRQPEQSYLALAERYSVPWPRNLKMLDSNASKDYVI